MGFGFVALKSGRRADDYTPLQVRAYRIRTKLFWALVLVLGPLGLWLGDNPLERALLVGCLLLVLSAELLNSALEAIVDKVSPEFHEFAGRAKDMGSAAVFVLMVNVVLCWALGLWPRLS